MGINRRSFVKKMSLAAGAITIAPNLNLTAKTSFIQQKEKTKRKYGVALMGLGYYSTSVLAPALEETENCYLAGIVTGTPEKEVSWKEKYNLKSENIYNYDNFDLIKDNEEIDYVYVVLPNSMHKEFTIRAANAGKHVLCEKPMAINSQECLDMINTCKSADRKLSIGYRLHYDPTTRQIMKMAKDLPYGNIKYLHAAAGFTMSESANGHWKQKNEYGGGALMDMGVYSIQAARYSTGMEPISVISAQDLTFDHKNYSDADQAMTWQLEFPGNITANLMTSFACSVNDLDVTAAKGWYKLKPFSGYRGVKGSSKNGPLDFPSINQQAAHMDDFALSIEKNKEPLVSGEEGYKDIIIVDAIKKSVKLKERIKI